MTSRIRRWITATALCMTALAVTATAGTTTWRELPRLPYTGSITGLAADDNGVLYAATPDHVYRSDDNGLTWTIIGEGIFWGSISDVATDPGHPNVLVVSSDTRVFWTNDNGVSWQSQRFEVNSHTGLGGGAGSVKVHPSSQLIYASNYLLRMNGAWQRILPDQYMGGVVFPKDGSVIGIASASSITDASVLRSVNGGISWSAISTVPGSGSLHLGKNERIYGSFSKYIISTTATGTVYYTMYSDDLGLTWTDMEVGSEGLPQPDSRPIILGIDTTSDRIFATASTPGRSSYIGVYYSDNAMKSWQLLDPGLENIQPVEMQFMSDGRIFFATSGHGILEYEPVSAVPVAQRNNGIFSYTPVTLTMTAQNDLLTYNYTGMLISRDGGQTWQTLPPNQLSSPSSMLALPSGDILAGGIGNPATEWIPESRLPLFRSSDGGESWTALGEEMLNTKANWTQITAMFADKDGTIYASTYSSGDTAFVYQLYMSADNGTTWQWLSNVLTTTTVAPSGTIYTIGMAPDFSFAFLRSGDHGVTWDTITAPDNVSFNSNPILTPGPDNALYFSAQNSPTYVSYDNGATWEKIPGEQFRVYFDNDGNAYRVYEDVTVHFVASGSSSPVDVSRGLPSVGMSLINIVFDTNNTPYASLSDGRLFRLVEDVASSVGTPGEAVTAPAAYPNPFTGLVTIRYTLPVASEVTLSVTDVTGRTVRTVTLPRQQAGEGTVAFEGVGLAPGLYIYNIIAGNSVQSGTIVRR